MRFDSFHSLLEQYKGEIQEGPNRKFDADTLRGQVKAWITHLSQNHPLGQAVGILADNSLAWLAVDLACANLDIALVPLPAFFTDEQLKHAIREAGITTLVTDQGQRAQQLGFQLTPRDLDAPMLVLRKLQLDGSTPAQIQKITFTSGTTGEPKGVCLSETQQLAVAEGLMHATESLGIKRHLCLLPLGVLLENIAGVYAPMMAGADIICPPLAQTGLKGAASFDAQQCLDTIASYRAESIILLPQMLMALLQASTPGDARWQSLKFIAVGGGKVPIGLLTLAKWFNLPVYEGYGLSECASVVCLNTPENNRLGTVGKPILGVEVKVDSDQEIWVKGRHFSGYLHDLKAGKANSLVQGEWLPTGDLGKLDAEGYLTIHGRKKNLIITGFGRNISPEWPEGLLLSTGLFLQAAVFGEGKTGLTAMLVLRDTRDANKVDEALQQVNQQLPDYARIAEHLVISEPFSFSNGLCTANGRIRRDAIWHAYNSQLNGETV
ncbi:MAG: AMP-binding protein [Burkholderiales bacterium]|jgi:long-chain acyl-CoA synthetase|uniref:AMP-binding protein n=1 Tax=Limnobacter sp. TaxID=2003368 RepID=UPI00393A6376|nr:AMP-binding protein [Burkholderiales bacterium]